MSEYGVLPRDAAAMTYLDHAATTPMLPGAVAAMRAAMTCTGAASSRHSAGRAASRVVEESRSAIAAGLGARPSEVVFTGGGTAGANQAVKGIFWARRAADPRRTRVLVSATEHHAVTEAAEWLARHQGAELERVAVDTCGRVYPEVLRAALAAAPHRVALVSVMWANNEVGTVNPIRELAAVAHEFDVPLHTDAVQAAGVLPVDFARCGADALTLTGHKLGGPHGQGVLLLSRELACVPLLHGGGENVPAVAALAAAIRHAVAAAPRRAPELTRLRDELVGRVLAEVPDAVVNGDRGGGCVDGGPSRLPGIAHLSFPGCEGDSLVVLMDARGIACSTGSACTAGVPRPSHVLRAMGACDAVARGSLRFSFGHTSTAADVAAVARAIGPVVQRARSAGHAAGIRRAVAAR
jgi:cysteine desulfurase